MTTSHSMETAPSVETGHSPAAYRLSGDQAQIRLALTALGDEVGTALVERLDSLRFLRQAEVRLEEWETGRAFGPEMELRWRHEGDLWEALLITDLSAGLPAAFERVADLKREGEPVHYCLWGQRDGDVFREDRLPDDLHYPITGGPRLMLEAQLYRVEAEPLPSLLRYRRLIPEKVRKD